MASRHSAAFAFPEDEGAFVAPPWDAPVDLEAVVAVIPSGNTTRGLFFNGLADRMVEAGAPRPGRWVGFKSYPAEDYARLLVACARAWHPGLPLGRALRAVGRSAYPTFAQTTAGRVMFAFAGSDPKAALRLAPKAWEVATAGTSDVTLVEGGDVDILRIRRMHSFPELHEVGVIEGGVAQFGAEVDIRIRVLRPGDVDLRIEWLRR